MASDGQWCFMVWLMVLQFNTKLELLGTTDHFKGPPPEKTRNSYLRVLTNLPANTAVYYAHFLNLFAKLVLLVQKLVHGFQFFEGNWSGFAMIMIAVTKQVWCPTNVNCSWMFKKQCLVFLLVNPPNYMGIRSCFWWPCEGNVPQWAQ